MFLFQYHEDNLRLLEEERKRDERRNGLLRDLLEVRRTASPAGEDEASARTAAPRAASYTGPERRLVPCPEMKEAMIP